MMKITTYIANLMVGIAAIFYLDKLIIWHFVKNVLVSEVNCLSPRSWLNFVDLKTNGNCTRQGISLLIQVGKNQIIQHGTLIIFFLFEILMSCALSFGIFHILLKCFMESFIFFWNLWNLLESFRIFWNFQNIWDSYEIIFSNDSCTDYLLE